MKKLLVVCLFFTALPFSCFGADNEKYVSRVNNYNPIFAAILMAFNAWDAARSSTENEARANALFSHKKSKVDQVMGIGTPYFEVIRTGVREGLHKVLNPVGKSADTLAFLTYLIQSGLTKNINSISNLDRDLLVSYNKDASQTDKEQRAQLAKSLKGLNSASNKLRLLQIALLAGAGAVSLKEPRQSPDQIESPFKQLLLGGSNISLALSIVLHMIMHHKRANYIKNAIKKAHERQKKIEQAAQSAEEK